MTRASWNSFSAGLEVPEAPLDHAGQEEHRRVHHQGARAIGVGLALRVVPHVEVIPGAPVERLSQMPLSAVDESRGGRDRLLVPLEVRQADHPADPRIGMRRQQRQRGSKAASAFAQSSQL